MSVLPTRPLMTQFSLVQIMRMLVAACYHETLMLLSKLHLNEVKTCRYSNKCFLFIKKVLIIIYAELLRIHQGDHHGG
jgi:hypothetical protein